jgi:hypothetical protein
VPPTLSVNASEQAIRDFREGEPCGEFLPPWDDRRKTLPHILGESGHSTGFHLTVPSKYASTC